MNENTRNAFASYGLEILKRSVLLVLYEGTDIVYKVSPYAQGRILTAGEIRQRLGILQPRVISGNVNALIPGVLDHLQHHGQAHHYNHQGWAPRKAYRSLRTDFFGGLRIFIRRD